MEVNTSSSDLEDKLVVYVHDLPASITEERVREIFSNSGTIARLELRSEESSIDKKIAVIHFSSARGVHAALLMTRDPINYDLTFTVSKQLRNGISPNKPASVPQLKLPAMRHKRRLSQGDVMFEVRTVYSNIEKVMDLITVHTLLEFLTKNGYACDEDQVREIFLESFKPKNSRGVTYDEFVTGFVAYIKAVQKLPLRKDRQRKRTLSRQKSLREELQEQKNLQEQLEKRASFQKLVSLLGADEQVTSEFETILSARRPKSPQAPAMLKLTDSSEDLMLSLTRDFNAPDTPTSASDEFRRSKITVRKYDEPKEPEDSEEEMPQTAIVHERAEEAKNSSDSSSNEDNTQDKEESASVPIEQVKVQGIEPINTEVPVPYLGIKASDSATSLLPGSPSLTNTPPYFNFDDYVSRDELKLIEEAIMTLRQDTKLNLVKVRKALVKHNLRNEEFEKSLKELRKVVDEQRNNSKETADTLEKELTELWETVDVHLKEFKVDLFSEASRQIEEKSKESFDANTEQIDSLNEQIKELKAQVNSFDVNQLKQDLFAEIYERISAKENDRGNEMNELKKELHLLREENKIGTEQLVKDSSRANETVEELRNEIEKLKQLNKSTLDEQQEKTNRLSLEVEELHKKMNSLTNENEQLKGQINNSIQQITLQVSQSKSTNQTAELENLRSEMNALKQENSLAHEENKRVTREYNDSIEKLKQENSLAQEENKKIVREFNDLMESLKQEVQSKHNEQAESLRRELETSFKSEISRLQEQIDQSGSANNTKLESELNELKQCNETLKKQIDRSATSAELNELKERNETLMKQIDASNSEIESLKKVNESFSGALESIKSELASTKTQVTDLTVFTTSGQQHDEINGKVKDLEANLQLLREELKQHQQNMAQVTAVPNNYEELEKQFNELKSSVDELKQKANRAVAFIDNERKNDESNSTSIQELRTAISELAEKHQAKALLDRQAFEEFKLATEKQLQGLDYKSLIDTLSHRVDTVQESFSNFEDEFKPNVLALIDAHQALTSVNETCQKLTFNYDKLDDTVRHVSKSVDANNMTLDNFTKQLKSVESSKLPAAKFDEFVTTDWNSHVKSLGELQTLVKSLCETVKNSVAFSSDSPHDQTREIKYEEEFNLTAKKSTTLVQSIRTNNGPHNQHNRAGQMDRMSKVFTKFLTGTGVGLAAGLMTQLILGDKSVAQDARQILRKIIQTGLSFGILIGLSKITSHALHSLHLFNGTANDNQQQKSVTSKRAITTQFLGYNLVGSLFASVCLTGLSGHWNVVTRSTLIGTCSALMFHICLRLRKSRNVNY